MKHRPAAIAAALLLPPLGVYRAVGAGPRFTLTAVLTMLGFVPGMVAALVTVLNDSERPRLHGGVGA